MGLFFSKAHSHIVTHLVIFSNGVPGPDNFNVRQNSALVKINGVTL